jgi:hypothetical protein
MLTLSGRSEELAVAAKMEVRIEALEERLKKLKTKHQRAQARARTVQNRTARREDTRRRFLVGAIVIARVDQGLLEKSVLRGWLEGALERPDDRALFELPPR